MVHDSTVSEAWCGERMGVEEFEDGEGDDAAQIISQCSGSKANQIGGCLARPLGGKLVSKPGLNNGHFPNCFYNRPSVTILNTVERGYPAVGENRPDNACIFVILPGV